MSPPIACNLSNDCYIQQYVDRDPGAGILDFTCSFLSYNGHQGTDFAVPDLRRMAQGVDVLASAGGTIKAVRDGMPDTGYTPQTQSDIVGRECGNGVVIDHGRGWETQYCHMKQGSVTVTGGQQIAVGGVLGQVGMSGRAEFPHVHLSVRQSGMVVDPFNSITEPLCSGSKPNSLWTDMPAYRSGGIISLGVADAVPKYAAVKAGTAADAHLDQSADQLVVFGYFFGTQRGDIVQIQLEGPDGPIINHKSALSRSQALAFRASGKKKRGGDWPLGAYEARVTLLRKETVIEARSIPFSLP